MATQFPETIPVPLVDPVATEINQAIDKLILSLEQRRFYLLTVLRDTREEMRHNQVALQQMEEELIETRDYLERQIKHNKLHSMQRRMVGDLEAKLAELELNEQSKPKEVKFLCDTQEIEEHINRMGEIIQIEIPPIPVMPEIPNYAAFQKPIVAVGEVGTIPGMFAKPNGLSVEKESGNIYVADTNRGIVQIFSETGEYLNKLASPHLHWPWGILTHQDSVYVTDVKQHAILSFGVPQFTMVNKVGSLGSGDDQFKCPKQLDISPNEHLYVADQENHRIQIRARDLQFKGSLRHKTMTFPVDVKFSKNEMFVLSRKTKHCIHVFSLSGEKISSLVTKRGDGMLTLQAVFFCLDGRNNFVISDSSSNSIKVFSPEGELLHTIGREGHGVGMFYTPAGVAILGNTKLVCVSRNFGLQIFSA